MGRPPAFPIVIRDQSAVVKIYREKSTSNKTGWNYRIVWGGAGGTESISRADLEEAKEEAKIKARHLAAGYAAAQHFQRPDLSELEEARRLTGDVPLLSAVKEWKRAHELAGAGVLEACEAWARSRTQEITRITVHDAINGLIESKNDADKRGERTYRSKLKPIEAFFGKQAYLDTITLPQWERYLARYDDPVTRNDHRKRAVTLCGWARKRNHLPRNMVPSIEDTERAIEDPKPIGIITPASYRRMLNYFYRSHREFLAPLVLAGLAGLRSDEIHGSRDDRERRQIWKDIRLSHGYLNVTAAKRNTPSHRLVHLCDAAIAWLRLCPNRRGYVCGPAAMERVRAIAKKAGFALPPNCFRHSYITYRVAKTGDKQSTSTEAGNSPKEIDRRYRVPQPRPMGVAWFLIRPPRAG